MWETIQPYVIGYLVIGVPLLLLICRGMAFGMGSLEIPEKKDTNKSK